MKDRAQKAFLGRKQEADPAGFRKKDPPEFIEPVFEPEPPGELEMIYTPESAVEMPSEPEPAKRPNPVKAKSRKPEPKAPVKKPKKK